MNINILFGFLLPVLFAFGYWIVKKKKSKINTDYGPPYTFKIPKENEVIRFIIGGVGGGGPGGDSYEKWKNERLKNIQISAGLNEKVRTKKRRNKARKLQRKSRSNKRSGKVKNSRK